MSRVLLILACIAAAAVVWWSLRSPSDSGRGGDPAPQPAALEGESILVPNERQAPLGPDGTLRPDLPPVIERSGRVLDDQGAPVAGMTVVASTSPVGLGGPFAEGNRYNATTATDAEGRFTLSLPRAGQFWIAPLTERAGPPFIGSPRLIDAREAPPEGGFELRVEPSTLIRGRVVLDGVQGIDRDGVRVNAIGQRTGHMAQCRIDAEGAFELEPVGAEPYIVFAASSAAVSEPLRGVVGRTADGAGASPAPVLTLIPVGAVRIESEGGTTAGLRVEGARHGAHPLELARLALSGRSPQYLLPGAYTLAVFTQDRIGHVEVGEVGTLDAPREVAVALAPAATLVVENHDTTPRILVVEQGGRVVRAQSFGWLARLVVVVPAGELTLTEYDLDGASLGVRTLTVTPGSRTNVDLGP